jgi:hypothetical protein
MHKLILLASAVTPAVLMIVGLLGPVDASGAGGHLKRPIVLTNKAVAGVALGTRATIAKSRLDAIFGKPIRTTTYSGTEAKGCGLDFSMSWPHFEAVFYRDHFVGYDTGYSTTSLSLFETGARLRVGDTVAEAKRIYGDTFRTSAAQGGSWSVARKGVYGYLVSPPRVGPNDRIAGIAAGHVGCPAVTP